PAMPRGGRGFRRARPSFVDESLFGSSAGTRPAPPAFAPPWAAPAPPGGGGGSRPGSKCRWRSHTPSFCDESLFGASPGGPTRAAAGLRKEDVAKLHTLLWSPPPAPQHRHGLSPRSTGHGEPWRAGHPPTPATPGPEVAREGQPCAWQCPERQPGPPGRGAPGRGCSRALHTGLCLGSEPCENQSPPTAPAAPRGPLPRARSRSMSRCPLAACSKAAGGCAARPPWK
ncbi:RITA1 protein, partial [Chordeiles acutipennis]|nr:RITA1 protein [Chordeiles acutipennis]